MQQTLSYWKGSKILIFEYGKKNFTSFSHSSTWCKSLQLQSSKRLKNEPDDYICEGHIYHAMSHNSLFDQYHKKKTAKEIWEALEAKCMLEDTTSKKFFVSKFFRYQMVDSGKIIEQFHKTTHTRNQFLQYHINMDVSIDKLPASWKDYNRSLKHRNRIYVLKYWVVISDWRKSSKWLIFEEHSQGANPRLRLS